MCFRDVFVIEGLPQCIFIGPRSMLWGHRQQSSGWSRGGGTHQIWGVTATGFRHAQIKIRGLWRLYAGCGLIEGAKSVKNGLRPFFSRESISEDGREPFFFSTLGRGGGREG